MAPTILVVDDHFETRDLIARLLELEGYVVAAVADSETALTQAAAQQPDLVIVDVLLPGIDGLRVIDALRQQDPRLPVIAISAVDNVLERPAWIPAGFDPHSIAFLAKPFELVSLLDLVRDLLTLPLPLLR